MRHHIMLCSYVLLAFSLLPAAARADAAEEREIVEQIAKACPAKRKLAEEAGRVYSNPKSRAESLPKYQELVRCAGSVSIVHRRIGFIRFESGDFAAAEASYRRAVELEANFTNKLALLEALLRQHKPEADALYRELAAYNGDRADVWANLAYAAFHHDDPEMMMKASTRAIELGSTAWQAYFIAAVAEGLRDRPDRAKALQWLSKAEELGAPAKWVASFREAHMKAKP
jgi:tetratricopeptide (TPR) repeat protein